MYSEDYDGDEYGDGDVDCDEYGDDDDDGDEYGDGDDEYGDGDSGENDIDDFRFSVLVTLGGFIPSSLCHVWVLELLESVQNTLIQNIPDLKDIMKVRNLPLDYS